MAFKSKPQNKQDDLIKGLGAVLATYDPLIFTEKAFEGLLADYIPNAYAFKMRLTLMAKSGYLKKLLELNDASHERVSKYAEQFSAYYGFEQHVIHSDFEKVFRARGLGSTLNTLPQRTAWSSRQPTEPTSNKTMKIEDEAKPSVKKTRQRRSVENRRLNGMNLLLGIGFLIATVLGYAYQINDDDFKTTLINGMTRISEFQTTFAYGLIGLLVLWGIINLIQQRLNKDVISLLPWLMAIAQCAMFFYLREAPQLYELIQLSMVGGVLLSFVATQWGALYADKTSIYSRSVRSFYLLSAVMLVGQYVVRTII